MTLAELREKCTALAAAGDAVAKATVELFATYEHVRKLADSLAERVAAQSELLASAATRDTLRVTELRDTDDVLTRSEERNRALAARLDALTAACGPVAEFCRRLSLAKPPVPDETPLAVGNPNVPPDATRPCVGQLRGLVKLLEAK